MPDDELYDLQIDPYEIHNFADSTQPEHRCELKKLRTVLEQWIGDTNDPGRIAEPPGPRTGNNAGAAASGETGAKVELAQRGHGKVHQTAGASRAELPGLTEVFRECALHWTPEEYVFYADSEEIWRTKAGGPCRRHPNTSS